MPRRPLPTPPATTAATHTTIPAPITIPAPVPNPALATIPATATIPIPPWAPNPTPTAPTTNNAPLSFDELMHHHWDANWLLRRSLSNFPEPVTPLPRPSLEARFRLFKAELESLEAVLAAVAPSRSSTVDGRIAVIRHNLKVLTWQLFPINDFPSEILFEIFRYALMSSRDDQQTVATRLLLTRVCRRWRQQALGDGMLWSQIVFRDGYPFTRSLNSLKRAGSIPLDIVIMPPTQLSYEPAPPPMHHPQSITYLVDQVLRRASTIRSLRFHLQMWETASIVFQKLGAVDMPLLEEFALHRSGNLYGWIQSGELQPAFKDPLVLWNGRAPPKLRTLLINGMTYDWEHVSSSNLTALDLRRMAMAACPSLLQFREMLSGCPRLFGLALDASGPRWEMGPENQNSAPVNIRSLRELTLGDQSVAYALFVLSQFTAPRLVFLMLLNLNGEDFGPVIQFLSGRFPLVQILEMLSVVVMDDRQQQNINMTRLVMWLQSMPDLTILKVASVNPYILEGFLCKLRIDDEEKAKLAAENKRTFGILCPRLKYLQFRAQQPAIIHRMASIRKGFGAPFDKATVKGFVWTVGAQVPEAEPITKQVAQEDIAFFASNQNQD
ncbi:hypothetical protein NLI96_g7004 [Meripilus lineatus]|uniref:F-box domain-containing protein n=1 Tax=Meripilus lineatus TaxID=2056292 RepID=A0AAD5YHM7_9APHY|nr:hypothetical protein NLI96_g7004 [Physisporinus lineatus]